MTADLPQLLGDFVRFDLYREAVRFIHSKWQGGKI